MNLFSENYNLKYDFLRLLLISVGFVAFPSEISVIICLVLVFTKPNYLLVFILFSQFLESTNILFQGFTISKVIAFFYLASFFIKYFKKKQNLIINLPLFIILTLFIIWASLGIGIFRVNFGASLFSNTLSSSISFVLILFITLIICIDILNISVSETEVLLQRINLMFIVISFVFLYLFLFEKELSYSWDLSSYRISVGIWNINQFAYLLVISIAGKIFLLIRSKIVISKVILVSLVLLELYMLLTTSSKTGFISLGLIIIVFFIVYPSKFRNKIIFLSTLSFVVFYVIYSTDYFSTIIARFTESLVSLDSFFTGRINLMLQPLVYILNSTDWILGLGTSQHVDRQLNILILGIDNVTHNSFVSIFIRNGIIGLILFLSLVYLQIKSMYLIIKRKINYFILFIPSVVLLFVALGYNLEYYELFWYWLVIPISMSTKILSRAE